MLGAPVENPAFTPEIGENFVSAENRNKIATPRPKFSPVVSKNMQDPTGKYMWLFSGSR